MKSESCPNGMVEDGLGYVDNVIPESVIMHMRPLCSYELPTEDIYWGPKLSGPKYAGRKHNATRGEWSGWMSDACK